MKSIVLQQNSTFPEHFSKWAGVILNKKQKGGHHENQ